MAESYESFEQHMEGRLKKDFSRAARAISEKPAFREIMQLVGGRTREHPKIESCINVVRSVLGAARRGIVFFEFKSTATCFKEKLEKAGFPDIRTLFGGKSKDVEGQRAVLEALRTREIGLILSTSVIEEGVAVPEVDIVIHYSMPPNPISRIQRSGRTARVWTGNVVYIALNHPLDMARYWPTWNGVRKMKELVSGKPAAPAEARARRPRIRKFDEKQTAFAFYH